MHCRENLRVFLKAWSNPLPLIIFSRNLRKQNTTSSSPILNISLFWISGFAWRSTTLGVIQKWRHRENEGRGNPKLVTKSDTGGSRCMQIVTSPPKKNINEPFSPLFLVSATAAELWLAFWWWCRFKHWPKSARAGEIAPLKFVNQI